MTVRRLGSIDVAHQPLWSARNESAPSKAAESGSAQHARQDADEAKQRGYLEGIAQGKAEGRKQADQEAATLAEAVDKESQRSKEKLEASRQRLDALFDSVSAALCDHARYAEVVAVEAAYAAIARFLGEGHADRSVMERLCRHAINHSGHKVNAVRLAEADADTFAGTESLKIIADASLLPGQCVLESRLGSYETGIDVKLELIKQALLAGLGQHRTEEQSE